MAGRLDELAAMAMISPWAVGAILVVGFNAIRMRPILNTTGYDESTGGKSKVEPIKEKDISVEQIIVIGHSRCGGIKGLMTFLDEGPHTTDFIEDWVKVCSPAKSKVHGETNGANLNDQCVQCEKFFPTLLKYMVLLVVYSIQIPVATYMN
ncbi:Carbonic anhydrase 1 [Artemisia annua]|uniref:Carbonic anhydrase n=1 Tax=Artemisia annua TaxID=35608 RepID=A0A2U1N7H3_ARTAN|nr:Carbonic anhydrase 1 [Artemisia annua]